AVVQRAGEDLVRHRVAAAFHRAAVLLEEAAHLLGPLVLLPGRGGGGRNEQPGDGGKDEGNALHGSSCGAMRIRGRGTGGGAVWGGGGGGGSENLRRPCGPSTCIGNNCVSTDPSSRRSHRSADAPALQNVPRRTGRFRPRTGRQDRCVPRPGKSFWPMLP